MRLSKREYRELEAKINAEEEATGEEVTLEFIEDFIDDKFEFDPGDARARALTMAAKGVVRGYRTSDGVRRLISFESKSLDPDKPTQLRLAFWDTTKKMSVVERQKETMLKTRDGCDKVIEKLDERLDVMRKQLVLDFDNEDSGNEADP